MTFTDFMKRRRMSATVIGYVIADIQVKIRRGQFNEPASLADFLDSLADNTDVETRNAARRLWERYERQSHECV